MPVIEQAIYKTNYELPRSYQRRYLLKPGNISVRQHCDVSYSDELLAEGSPYSCGFDSFDIRDNKFTTTFREGVVYLIFYATDYDEGGSQLIPDNYRVMEYIEAFLKYKIMETLTNQITDETFNQLQQKLVYYKQLSDEAYILAELELKRQTIYQKQSSIRKQLSSFNRYELPNRISRNGWRRNS